ncbi:MAG: T9SS type A sorting domain-containing protein, partial [Pedobacter sp.]
RDIDGKFGFSEIQYVGSKNEIAINVYPNPVAKEISVTYPQAKAQGKVTIYTIDGRAIVSENISAGSTISTIDVSAFHPSVYLIEVQNGPERAIKKLVKN